MVLSTARKQSTSEHAVHSFGVIYTVRCLRKLINAKYPRTNFSVDSQKMSPVNNGIYTFGSLSQMQDIYAIKLI